MNEEGEFGEVNGSCTLYRRARRDRNTQTHVVLLTPNRDVVSSGAEVTANRSTAAVALPPNLRTVHSRTTVACFLISASAPAMPLLEASVTTRLSWLPYELVPDEVWCASDTEVRQVVHPVEWHHKLGCTRGEGTRVAGSEVLKPWEASTSGLRAFRTPGPRMAFNVHHARTEILANHSTTFQ